MRLVILSLTLHFVQKTYHNTKTVRLHKKWQTTRIVKCEILLRKDIIVENENQINLETFAAIFFFGPWTSTSTM